MVLKERELDCSEGTGKKGKQSAYREPLIMGTSNFMFGGEREV